MKVVLRVLAILVGIACIIAHFVMFPASAHGATNLRSAKGVLHAKSVRSSKRKLSRSSVRPANKRSSLANRPGKYAGHQLVGGWKVYNEHDRPTDQTVRFEANGDYTGLFAKGTWRVAGRDLDTYVIELATQGGAKKICWRCTPSADGQRFTVEEIVNKRVNQRFRLDAK